MAEAPEQLTSVAGLTPEEIAAALEEGRLDEYVARQRGARGDADQGARGGGQQLTREDLRQMSAEEIEKARQEGRLDSLLKGETS